MTEAEKVYQRFVNHEWDEVPDNLKEILLKGINEVLIVRSIKLKNKKYE